MTKLVNRVGVVLVAAMVVSAACGGEQAEEAGPEWLTVQARRGNLNIQAEATGTVEPVRKVDVKSKASGEILRLHADVGDRVTRGTLLAEIDPRDVQNSYNQAQADLEVARARMEISEQQVERSRQLLEAQVITTQEHENARLDYTNAQAALVRAETNANLAQLQLADVRITAPMDGTIIQKNVEEGVVIQSASQNVSGGTTLFQMADLSQMQVRTLVDETDMGMLRANMPSTITVEAFPDQTFAGVIEKIEPQAVVEQNVTMFPVIVTLDNSSGLLRPGMNAEVQIFIDQARDVLLVPNNAIVKAADVGPAALALGLDIDNLDLTAFMGAAPRAGGNAGAAARAGNGGGGAARSGGNGGTGGGGFSGRNGGGRNGGAAANLDPALAARMQELRTQAESGAISQDSLRAAMQALRPQGSGGRAGGTTQTGEGGTATVETRPGAVFVLGPDGKPQPRAIQIGLGDWDNTSVTGDVQEGDTLIIIGAAQLQAQQQEFIDRMRQRMGGDNPFGGGVPGGGGFPGGGGNFRGGGGRGF
jgi:HlyD family secretion protein